MQSAVSELLSELIERKFVMRIERYLIELEGVEFVRRIAR